MTLGCAGRGFMVPADADRSGADLRYLNGRFDCKLSGADSEGRLCIYDTYRSTRGGPPLHYHREQDEWFFVREGEFVFRIGDDMFRLKAGDSVFGPRNVPHAFIN